MKNFKTRHFLLMLVCSFLFVSCDKDDTVAEAQQIVGVWECHDTERDVVMTNGEYYFETLEYKADGTGTSDVREAYLREGSNALTTWDLKESFTYTVEGNKITRVVQSKGQDGQIKERSVVVDFTLDGDELHRSGVNGETPWWSKYKRKK